jgi:hypothetical protein
MLLLVRACPVTALIRSFTIPERPRRLNTFTMIPFGSAIVTSKKKGRGNPQPVGPSNSASYCLS